MRLERLVIEGFRKLIDRHEIDGLGSGITVLSGDNEEGKSTVLAALKAAFFLRHTVAGAVRANLAPYGRAIVPHVELVFSTRGQSYHLEKSFKRGGVKLKTPHGTLDGETAEHKLAELLGFEQAARGGSNDDQTGLAGLFWMDQATTFEGFEPGRVGREHLTSAITQEVDAVAISDHAKAILARSKEQRDLYWQPARGQPRGPLLDLQQRIVELTGRRDALAQARKSLEERLVRLEGLHDERRRLLTADLIGEARQKADILRSRMTEIDGQRRRIAIERERLKAAGSALEAVERKRTARTDLIGEINARAVEQQDLEQQAKALRAQSDEMAGALAAAAAQLARYESDLEAGKCKYTVLQRRRQAVIATERLATLEQAQERLNQLLQVRHSTDRELAANPFDDPSIDELSKLATACREAQIALRSAATRLTFEPRDGSGVSLNGRSLDISAPVDFSRDAILELEGFGTVKVEPGGKEAAAASRDFSETTSAFEALLAKLGAEDLENALARAVQRRALEVDRRDASTRLAALLESYGVTDSGAFGVLVEQARQALGEVPDNDEDFGATEDAIRTAEAQLEALTASARRQRETVEGLERRHHELRQQSIRSEAISTTLAEQVARLTARLQNERAGESDDAIAKTRGEVERLMRELTARCSAVEDEVERADPEGADQALGHAERRVEQLVAERRDLDRRIADLELELRIKGGEGIGEQRSQAEGLLRLATTEHARIERRAKAWRLLHDELAAAEKAQRDRLVAPIVARMKPYLSRLFATSDPLGLDADKLSLAHLHRDGVAEDFERLSVGTREQLAVLVRLACAQLVAAHAGESPPIILDDALVYADERRFEIMKTILEQAAETIQILVLTCRPRDYFGMNAKFIRLEDCRKAETEV